MPDGSTAARTWKLQDAKARFSELVRDARANGPQTVTVHGKAAVVVLSAEAYAKLAGPVEPEPNLLEAFQNSPLRDLNFDFPSVRVRVRKPVF